MIYLVMRRTPLDGPSDKGEQSRFMIESLNNFILRVKLNGFNLKLFAINSND